MFCNKDKTYHPIILLFAFVLLVLSGVACSREKPLKVTAAGKQAYHVELLDGYLPKARPDSVFTDEDKVWSFDLSKDQVRITSFGLNNSEHNTYTNQGFRGEAIHASINHSGVMSVISFYSSEISEDEYYVSIFPKPGEASEYSFSLNESLKEDLENIPVVHILSNLDLVVICGKSIYMLDKHGVMKEKLSANKVVDSSVSANGFWTIDANSKLILYSNALKIEKELNLPDLNNSVISCVDYINMNKIVISTTDKLLFCDSNNAIQSVELSDYSISNMSGVRVSRVDGEKTEILGLACFNTIFGDDSYQMIRLTESKSSEHIRSEVHLAVIGQKYDLEPLVKLYNACSEDFYITVEKITSDEDCQNGVLSAEQVAKAMAKLKTTHPDMFYYGDTSFSQMCGFDFVPIRESIDRNQSMSLDSQSSAFNVKSEGFAWMPFYLLDGISIDFADKEKLNTEQLVKNMDESDFYEYLEDILYYHALSNYPKANVTRFQESIDREKAIDALVTYKNHNSENSSSMSISYIQGISTSEVLRKIDDRIELCGLPVFLDDENPQFRSLGEYYISRDTRQLEACEDFMRFVFSDQVQTLMCVHSYKAYPSSKQAIRAQASSAWMQNQYTFSDDSPVMEDAVKTKNELCLLSEKECVDRWLDWIEKVKLEHSKNDVVSYIIMEELFRFEDNIIDEQECLDSIQKRSNLYFSEVYG